MVLLFFDFGSGEILLIVLAIFLVFGPGKIPEMARNLGRFINEMKRATEDIKSEINREAERQERKKKLEAYKKELHLDEIKEDPAAKPYPAEETETPATQNEVSADHSSGRKQEQDQASVQKEKSPFIGKPEGSVPNG